MMDIYLVAYPDGPGTPLEHLSQQEKDDFHYYSQGVISKLFSGRHRAFLSQFNKEAIGMFVSITLPTIFEAFERGLTTAAIVREIEDTMQEEHDRLMLEMIPDDGKRH
jgi:hypothetical protein